MLAGRIVVAMCCAIRMSVLREFDGMDIAAVIEADPCRKGARNFVRGRDDHCWPPPAQIRTRPIKAYGSYLG
jgi:hypothetical protein